jgi:hypothetical protein
MKLHVFYDLLHVPLTISASSELVAAAWPWCHEYKRIQKASRETVCKKNACWIQSLSKIIKVLYFWRPVNAQWNAIKFPQL